MTTIETALSMTVLVSVTAAIIGGIATIAAFISAVDTACLLYTSPSPRDRG